MKEKKSFAEQQREPSGTYQVWHRDAGGETFAHAFDVQSDNLLEALIAPMLASEREEMRERVEAKMEVNRATTIGDVIVTPHHDAYQVFGDRYGATFYLTEFPPAQTAKLMAEQREEARAGVADGLKAGATLKDVTREAATYGVKPEEVADLRAVPEEDRRAAEIIAEMTPDERANGFRALLGSSMGNSHHLEDADGQYRIWRDLSPAGQLRVISDDAAYYDMPFEAFVAAAKEHVGPEALLDASLRVLFNYERDLTAIGRELPDDGRTEPTPLVDQVKNLLADLAHAEGFIRRQQEPQQEEHER